MPSRRRRRQVRRSEYWIVSNHPLERRLFDGNFYQHHQVPEQGIKGIDVSTKRAAALKAAAKKMGVKVTNIYWTLGEYDGLLILEAPDDVTAMTVLLHLAALGNVHTTTVRAFTAAEMDKIVATVHVD